MYQCNDATLCIAAWHQTHSSIVQHILSIEEMTAGTVSVQSSYIDSKSYIKQRFPR